jgi:hypothetical protein
MLYYIDRFPVLKEQCDTVTAVAALVAQEWASLAESAKAEYRKQAEATQSARKSLCFFEKDDEDVLKPRGGIVTPKKVNASQKKTTAPIKDVEVTKDVVTPETPAGSTDKQSENAAPAEMEANTEQIKDVVTPETAGSTEPPAEVTTGTVPEVETKTILEAAEDPAAVAIEAGADA